MRVDSRHLNRQANPLQCHLCQGVVVLSAILCHAVDGKSLSNLVLWSSLGRISTYHRPVFLRGHRSGSAAAGYQQEWFWCRLWLAGCANDGAGGQRAASCRHSDAAAVCHGRSLQPAISTQPQPGTLGVWRTTAQRPPQTTTTIHPSIQSLMENA